MNYVPKSLRRGICFATKYYPGISNVFSHGYLVDALYNGHLSPIPCREKWFGSRAHLLSATQLLNTVWQACKETDQTMHSPNPIVLDIKAV